MSASFYNYLIDTLLAEHLRVSPALAGEHYCLLVENEEHRKAMIAAIRQSPHSTPLTVSRIFEGRMKDPDVDRYDTVEFHPADAEASAPLIVADVNSGGEYLPTIRNSVNTGKKYQDKATLFILSNYASVDTLSTASINLEAPGMPFHADRIFENIRRQIDGSAALSNNEKAYMSLRLTTVTEATVSDYTLFDFQEILSVIKDQTLKGHFTELGFFPDSAIYQSGVQEVNRRAEDNHEIFGIVKSIMANLDREVQKSLLDKHFDDRMTSRLISEDTDWSAIEYEDLRKSRELRRITTDLSVERIEYFHVTGGKIPETRLISKTTGRARKQRIETVICVPDDVVRIRITFNKGFDKSVISKTFGGKKNDRTLTLSLRDAASFNVGSGNNRHTFAFLVADADPADFREIHDIMRLSVIQKKTPEARITVTVPDDLDRVCFGAGSDELPPDNIIDWTPASKITFESDSSDDDARISRKVRFGISRTVVEFAIRFDNDKIQNRSALEIFDMVWRSGLPFHDIRLAQNGTYTYSVIGNGVMSCSTPMKNKFRGMLLIEQRMIDEQALAYENVDITDLDCIPVRLGDLTQPAGMEVPREVRDALLRLYDYYRTHNTVPTLCPVNTELASLLEAYVNAVDREIESISDGSYMSDAQYWLTRLGTVRCADGRLWLSPFHPLTASFLLELSRRFDNDMDDNNVLKLVGPYYLIPYLTVDDTGYSPLLDYFTEGLKTWVCYCPVADREQNYAQNIAVKMVKEKMEAFLSQMKFLFPDKECPVIINTFGISDDTHIVKGLIQFVLSQYGSKDEHFRVQKIQLHEYVDNFLTESLLERLNRLGSDALVSAELKRIGLIIDLEAFSVREIIHQIFSRIQLFKHLIEPATQLTYSHLAFYQIRTGQQLRTPDTGEMRTETSLGGLISVPSTSGVQQHYTIGFGTQGLPPCTTQLLRTAKDLNSLYANERQRGRMHPFSSGLCVAKSYVFKEDTLLDAIYDSSNWVTFLNPEVDLDFFYNQDVYIVYYTDQYSINSKFDSITVTRQVERYRTLLQNSFQAFAPLASTTDMAEFVKTVLAYFNSLNGRWLMDITHRQVYQVREKISIVAALKVAERLLSRIGNTVWIPVSLDEILRVSGSIGLPKDSLFSVSSLKAGGIPLCDDLLMMGCCFHTDGHVSLMLYPVEVKASKSDIHTPKGRLQVANTCRLLRDHLTGDRTFVKDVYRVFFSSVLLGNADKLHANRLLDDESYRRLQSCRHALLDGEFDMSTMPSADELGAAALITINQDAPSNTLEVLDGIPVKHVNIYMDDCASIIMDAPYANSTVLASDPRMTESFRSTLESFRRGDPDEEPAAHHEYASETEDDTSEEDDDIYVDAADTPVEKEAVAAVPEVPEEKPVARQEPEIPEDERISILIGHTRQGDAPIYFYPNDTRQVSHPNLGIIGTMGTGKTQFARSVIAQLSREYIHNVGRTPIGMLIFDYKGDYNKADFLSAVKGECYNGNFPFNPLKLIVTPGITSMNLPAITADRIADSMRKSFRLGDVQYITIKDAVLDAYAEAGITRDPSTWNRTPPTMSDVVRIYLENHDAKDKVYSIFRNLDDYGLFTSDNSQCVSLFEWLTSAKVIDLTLFADNIKKLAVSLILDLFYAEMQQLGESRQQNGFREIRAMILVDEAHQFMKMKFNSLRRIISEGRAFGVGMILSTQNLSDFKADEDYATFFKSWVVHGVNNPTRSDLAVVFGATDPQLESYMDFINNARTFDSICRIGSLVAVIKDLPYFRLIQDDPRFS